MVAEPRSTRPVRFVVGEAQWRSIDRHPSTQLAAGVHSLSVNYQSFIIINPLNRSTAVPEKNSF